jgi:hypothetical protein
MSKFNSLLKLVGPCALIGATMLTGCSGGGSSTSSGSSASFVLLDSNVKGNTTWQINRQMQFKFSRAVDFSSVNLNTISIFRVGGAPATGEFLVGTQPGSTPGSLIPDPTIVVFQPACPKLADYSDAGLLPGGVSYTIDIKAGLSGIRSTSGVNLSQEQTIAFATPNSTQAAVLFIDPQVGPPLPRIYNPASTPAVTSSYCYVELGADADPDHGVRFVPPDDPNLGSPTPASFLAPLNLYSNVATRVVVVLELNQPVNPATTNVSASNIAFEYLDGADASIPANWKSLPHEVNLVANCTSTGSRLRIVPIGILPQGRTVRVVITPDFKDLVGDANPIAVVVGSFVVSTAFDPGTTTPGVAVDEVYEGFDVNGAAPASLEDTTTALIQPRAAWGGGELSAAFAFGGTGGPGGDFDWQIGDDTATPLVALTLDTTYTLITNTALTNTEAVVNGVVDVRNFTIKPNGKLTIQGVNPCKILASGTVTINGQLVIKGTNNLGINSFDTTNISAPGSAGQAGGGRGGTANYNTSASTPVGQAGYGAFDAPNGGGGGGETGYSANDENFRRGAGGGGGRFGGDVTFTQTTPSPAHPCPDQSIMGLDAENGFGGAPMGNGALSPIGTPPHGGARGPQPFFDVNPVTGLPNTTNDFWGTMLTQTNQLIQGELVQPWAGAGGGAGGNACGTATFPTTPWTATGDEKGAGGGGGGGSLTILALGDIVIGQTASNTGIGSIDASGGTGGGGENTNNLNHVGAGSGGGSGGHVILQTASNIDFTRCKNTTNPPGGIYALGGQGGQGFLVLIQDGTGGAQGGFNTTPWADALPANNPSLVPPTTYPAYPSTSSTTPCRMFSSSTNGTVPPGAPTGTVVYTSSNTLGDNDPTHVLIGGGGDGGPGLIQLHVPALANIKAPIAPVTFYKILKPPPIGTTLSTINLAPATNWGRLLPIFGPKSQALSKWVPLGAASVDPVSSTPKIVDFLFGGTDPSSGLVSTTGSGAMATVAELPAILTGTVAAEPALPFITADKRSVVFDSTLLTDDIYTRNPEILKGFALKLTAGSTTSTFDVASASFDVGAHQLRVTVSTSGMPLGPFAPGNAVELRPRFFKVETAGVQDSLPQSPGVGQPGTTITIEFQATSATATGLPDETTGVPSMFETDISRLSNTTVYPAAAAFRFIRFRVTFDLLDNGGQLSFSTPIPSLEFFKLPFKF